MVFTFLAIRRTQLVHPHLHYEGCHHPGGKLMTRIDKSLIGKPGDQQTQKPLVYKILDKAGNYLKMEPYSFKLCKVYLSSGEIYLAAFHCWTEIAV